MRASGLAQARLQVAVLSGNRRRALEQIDRLVAIDRQLERVAAGSDTAEGLADDLDIQRLALASEKLVLTSAIELPRLEPAFGAGYGEAIAPTEAVEIVEDEAMHGHLRRWLAWSLALVLLATVVTTAALILL